MSWLNIFKTKPSMRQEIDETIRDEMEQAMKEPPSDLAVALTKFILENPERFVFDGKYWNGCHAAWYRLEDTITKEEFELVESYSGYRDTTENLSSLTSRDFAYMKEKLLPYRENLDRRLAAVASWKRKREDRINTLRLLDIYGNK